MKYSSLVFIFCLSTLTIFAQKQANVWHFGDGHSLDFSSGDPVQTTGSVIQTFEGSTSYCDSMGNLLFYTNGGGREPAFSGQDGGHIWNRNNGVMYDMQGTQGGGFSSRQSAVAFEAPGQSDVYYVFTMDEIEYNVGASPATNATQPLGRGLRYFTVDMNQNGGLGSVVLADQPVYAPSAEGLCAIRHANKIDYWILINQDSTGIGVYSVTSSGVSFVTNYTATGGGPGIIKASPDGSKVRIGEYLLDFNNSNGQLSNPLNLSASEFFEFSPNSRFLYEITSPSVGPIVVSRYDLQAASIPSSISTIGIINAGLGSTGGQMQMGPDGKIYFLEVNFPVNTVTMHRVNCPNTQASSVQLNIFSYAGFFVGLPNFPAWLFENNDSTFVSLGPDTLRLCTPGQTFTLNAQNPGASYLWSTGATTQNISANQIGTYSVTVTGSCGTGVDEVVVSTCAPANNNNCLVFEYTGAPQQWTVPAGVDSIRLKMWGAAGGGGPDATNNAGGGGGYTEITVPVIAGDVLQIVVGGGGEKAVGHTGGAGGYGGGGDGGSGNRVETLNGIPTNVGGAGGGGGLTVVRMIGSINNILGMAGAGGGASFNRSGGGGGGLDAEFTAANNQFNLNGFGGTQTAGGAPSSNTLCGHPVSGTAGAGQQGGTGATDLGGSADRTGGGGGGAGYFGGGGGGSHDGCFGVGSTGGGGSGFVCSTCPGLTGFTQTAGFFGVPANDADPLLAIYPGIATGVFNQNGGNGIVQICYLLPCAATTDSISITACNDFTNPLGAIFTQSGIYNYTLTSSTGCDSIIVLDLTIIPFSQTQLNVTACDSFTDVNGNAYFQSTVFNYTLVGSNGCDSIISVNLTINGTIQTPVQNVSACNTYTAQWGIVYNQSGIYSDTLTTSGGCDSIISVNLTINGTIQTPVQNISACNSYTAPWGTVYNQSGIYSDTLTSVVGCDSIISINLTINGTIQTPVQNISACNSYTAPWGITYTQSGIYSDTLTTTGGCDSIISINLSINGIIQTPVQNVSACNTFTAPWGTAYTLSGIYSDTIQTAGACDTIISINLSINQLPVLQIIADTLLCSGENLILTALSSNAQTYLWSDGSTGTQLSITQGGNYSVSVENNCGVNNDIVQITEENCDTPQCNFLIPNAFTPNGDGVNDNWYIQCIELYPDNEVEIYNRWGQQVYAIKNYAGNWDGTFNGTLLPDAAYYYILKIKFPLPTGERIYTGTVSIIR